MMVVIISGLPVGISMVVGLFVSLIQATTQIQEQTLSFVPKMLVVLGLLGLMGYWMMAQMIRFSQSLYEAFPKYLGG
ncbi:MAG: flagellar biosynthetic protein FliQ [Candidatus Schekmanbacteria bacterium]|nr:flagellar biosynthetic protein FliQ [Candidatus Schekmanbacteria bacterium]